MTQRVILHLQVAQLKMVITHRHFCHHKLLSACSIPLSSIFPCKLSVFSSFSFIKAHVLYLHKEVPQWFCWFENASTGFKVKFILLSTLELNTESTCRMSILLDFVVCGFYFKFLSVRINLFLMSHWTSKVLSEKDLILCTERRIFFNMFV